MKLTEPPAATVAMRISLSTAQVFGDAIRGSIAKAGII
jgi:hypothetical protein